MWKLGEKIVSSYSLLPKLLLALTALTTAVIGPVGYYWFDSQHRNASAQLEAHATQMANLLGTTLAVPLWNIDHQALEDQVNAVMTADPQVFSVTLFSAGAADPLVSKKRNGQVIDEI